MNPLLCWVEGRRVKGGREGGGKEGEKKGKKGGEGRMREEKEWKRENEFIIH